MALKSGHRVVPLAFEEATKQYEQFQSYRSGTIRLDPDGWFFTTHYITYADKYHDFKFKSSDVVIMTYPKCGTTWTQEIVWTMMHNPNLNNAQATLPIVVRSPFLEVDFFLNGLPHNLAESSFLCDVFLQTHPNRNPKDGMFIQFAELAKEPRIIKTHLPFSLLAPNLPVTSKIIYMVRDPKDVAVSYCHHSKLMKAHDFVGTMSQFVDHFVNDTLIWGPFWKHVKEAWKKKHQFNVHFMYYEEMKANPKAEILRLQKFLNVNLTESQIDEIIHYTSFEEMKKREGNNIIGIDTPKMLNSEIEKKDGGFFRKGVTGDYRNKLSENDIKKINKWTKENTQDMDDTFKYKIK